jgi:Rrf2 family iron-sulfur cluster assembly transcriptional regulator
MIFSTSAAHALRAAAHLAASEEGEATLGRDLAAEVGVPAAYLAKVLGTLTRNGIVQATRGARGGYRLARPADAITILEVVEPFEGRRVRPGCLLRPDDACDERRPCSVHASWAAVKKTYLRFLERTTLADIRAGARSAAAPRAKRRRRPAPPPRRKARP